LAVHLLISLLGDRRTAAYRALDQCGVDKRRLRLSAMNQALGALGRKPIESAEAKVRPLAAEASAGRTTQPRAPRTPLVRRRAQLVSPEDLRRSRRRPELTPPQDEPAPEATPVPVPTLTPSPAGRVAAPKLEPRRVAAPSLSRNEDELERRFGLPRKQFPLLSRFGDNLTLAAARGQLDRCVCRDPEIERVLDVLCKRFGNNPCLVGPSGVGKTRIVHGVAQQLARKQTDGEPWLIIELGAAALVNGTGVRGGLAQRMQALRRE